MIRTNKRVALYARFSSDNQRSESIDAQIRAMKQYCEQHNYIIVDTYIDSARSAVSDRRPSFQRLIADSALKIFDIVLVHKLDRFSRNRYDSAVYKRELKKNGVMVCSVLENLDNSPESVMLEAVLEGAAEYYSVNLARETMKGMRESAFQAKHVGGVPPLGFDIDEESKRLIINPYEAESVQIIFDMYSKGHGYSAILDRLSSEGRLTKAGKPFRKNSLHSILTNPKYQGVYVFNRSAAKNSAGKRNTHLFKDNDEIIMIEGGCPQIVTKEVYDKVQERVTMQKHTGARNMAKETYLLSGKVFCNDCGRTMVGNRRKSGRSKAMYVTYRCLGKRNNCNNKEINKELLEHYVISLLETEIFNSAALKRLAKKIGNRAESACILSEETRLREELDSVKQALVNVADAIATGLISESLIAKLSMLEAQKAKLESQIAKRKTVTNKTDIDTSLILSQYNELKKTPSNPEYKDFIRDFIAGITVGKYTVAITLKTGLDIAPDLDTTFTVNRKTIYEKGA